MDPCWAPPRNWEMLPEWSVANGFRIISFKLFLNYFKLFLNSSKLPEWSVANGFGPN